MYLKPPGTTNCTFLCFVLQVYTTLFQLYLLKCQTGCRMYNLSVFPPDNLDVFNLPENIIINKRQQRKKKIYQLLVLSLLSILTKILYYCLFFYLSISRTQDRQVNVKQKLRMPKLKDKVQFKSTPILLVGKCKIIFIKRENYLILFSV